MVNGLSKDEVIENRKKYGNNRITTKEKESFFKLFLETLADPIIRILLIALAVKTIFLFRDFDWFETIGIVVAILIASLISAISEYGSEEAFKRLQEESSKIKCKVLRDSVLKEISIDDIVCHDVVLLQTGDMIPADGIIIKGEVLVDQSSINGEAIEVLKSPSLDKDLYRGTVVYSKEGYMLVKSVGDNTFYGKMAKELQEKAPESPLKLRLRGLAEVISKIGYIGAVLVGFSYLFSELVVSNGFDFSLIKADITNFPLVFGHILYALTLAVTIIVVAVPEGLPMMITLVLSSNMKRMLKNNVLVRKMVGIETAGSLNILFTDKTGTLTKGKLETVNFVTGSLNEYKSEVELVSFKRFHRHLKNCCIYNNASSFDNDKNVVGGNITDRAVLSFIKTNPDKTLKELENFPFDSKNKYSYTVVFDDKKINYIKGAYDILLPKCNRYLKEDGSVGVLLDKRKLDRRFKASMEKGIRIILLAYNDSLNYREIKDLVLIGAFYIKDDVRAEASLGISMVRDAGVNTVMITGDNVGTATNIGKEVGLVSSDDDVIITSSMLNEMSDDEVKKILPRLKIVARSLPQDKNRLVRISQDMGLVVGMTGDGVNDAPALKRADVGFAMGSGTEVSKEASDIVILDDNFLSISKAILFGRTIFKSIRKFIIFQLTINLCAISLSIIGPFIGIESPVTVIQMLWVNMIMDTLAGIAFSYEPPLLEYMKEAPKRKDEHIINPYMYKEILFTGIYSSILCVFFLKSNFIHNFFRFDVNDKYLMTGFFALFIFMGIFNCFNARTHRINILANIFKNRVFLFVIIFVTLVQIYLIYFGGELFRSFGLSIKELELTILLASTVVPIDWIRKIYLKRKKANTGV